VGLFYYTRVVVAMWVREPSESADSAGAAVGGASGAVLATLTAFLIVFGVYPAPLIQLIERAVASLP
jgi:NADH:ubiquinone oxidoreductase subunit 2 (subunit N)